MKINVSAGIANQTIDFSKYKNGIYLLRVVDRKDEDSFKIILAK